ncbi:MAG: hypothetical protein M1549_02250 [Candidatus Dependentiae bacterium]|nr:hypothetical protein [Candidatus Dependentiae bacterium]
MKHITFLLFALFAIRLPQGVHAGNVGPGAWPFGGFSLKPGTGPRSNSRADTPKRSAKIQEWTGAMRARAVGGTAGIGLMLLGGTGLWYAQGWRKKLYALGALSFGGLLTYLCKDDVHRLCNDMYSLGDSGLTRLLLSPTVTRDAPEKMSSDERAKWMMRIDKITVILGAVCAAALGYSWSGWKGEHWLDTQLRRFHRWFW